MCQLRFILHYPSALRLISENLKVTTVLSMVKEEWKKQEECVISGSVPICLKPIWLPKFIRLFFLKQTQVMYGTRSDLTDLSVSVCLNLIHRANTLPPTDKNPG